MPYYGTYHFAHLICTRAEKLPYEQLVYHPDFLRFHTRFVEAAKKLGRTFRDYFADEFKMGTYSDLLAEIDASESSIADELLKNGRGEDEVIWQIIHYRMYREVQSIAKGTGTLQGIDGWVSMYNRYMKCGTASMPVAAEARPVLRINFGSAERFSPQFLGHVLHAFEAQKPCSPLFDDLAAEMHNFLKRTREMERFDLASMEQFIGWVQLYDTTTCQDFEE